MYAIIQSCLLNRAPVITLVTEAQMAFSGWQFSMGIATHQCLQSDTSSLHGLKTTEAPYLLLLLDSAIRVLPLADLICILSL